MWSQWLFVLFGHWVSLFFVFDWPFGPIGNVSLGLTGSQASLPLRSDWPLGLTGNVSLVIVSYWSSGLIDSSKRPTTC